MRMKYIIHMYDRLHWIDQLRKNQKNTITSINVEWYTCIQWVSDSSGQLRINMGDNGIKGCEIIVIFVQEKSVVKKIYFQFVN